MEKDRTPSLKERLFECYAANLSACEPGLHGVFRCPICLREFGREAIDSNEVTKEHVPGESLGGRVWTLTCRDCNNAAGSELESELTERLAVEDWDRGVTDKPRRGRTCVGNRTITLDVYHRGDQYFVRPHQHLSDPKAFGPTMANWGSGVIPAGLEVEWERRYDGLRSWISALRMGYLLAFGYFGYGYIMQPNLQQVRDQIQNRDEQVLPTSTVRGPWKSPYSASLLGLLYEPSQLRCFCALVQVSTSVVQSFYVVLPGLDADNHDVYNRWAQSAGTIGGLRAEAVFLPFDPDFVCDPTNVDLASRIWSSWRKPLATWAGKSRFHYDGSVDEDTTIWYGSKPYHTCLTEQQYGQLLQHFRGRTVALGTSREPPRGSVGAWLQEHVTKRAIASYVGPILVHEGYAERVHLDSTKIRFK